MRSIFLLTISTLLFASCGGGGADKLVTIKTEMGDLTVLLYEETPMHKANFLELAESGQYDSTIFHRVIENFMIQGGDVFQKTGTPETETDRIPAEIVPGFYHIKGALAAARQPDQVNPEKLSSSCQFYIVDGASWQDLTTDINQLHGKLNELLIDSLNNPEIFSEFDEFRKNRDRNGYMKWAVTKRAYLEEKFGIDLSQPANTKDDTAYEEAGAGYPPLDGDYTVFGRVVEGLDVIDKIAAVKTMPGDRPVSNLFLSMEVKTVSKSEITSKYGYEYPSK
ncbi:MAG: peptidylprolyl isomerase [Cyclobacteriaceae bacterium]